jgi:hypothetical protein
MIRSTLLAGVRELLPQVALAYEGTPEAAVVAELVARLDEPLRVAVAGKVKAGKSTLLNALVGERLAPTDAGECTRIVTWYREGLSYRALVEPVGGALEPAPFSRDGGSVEVDLGGLGAEQVQRIVVEWPASLLRTITLVDTPGLGSLSAETSERTLAFLGEDDQPTVADAVIYLMRHVHHDDVRFLDAFRDDSAAGSPVNAVGVLSRADEIGGARLDAVESAARIATRYRLDPTVRRVCSTIVPVAGLLAEAAATLTEAEFRAVARLAALPDEARSELLLSSDRFVDPDATTGVAEAERAHLLGRLGLFGVRLAVDRVAAGAVSSSRQLADELRAVSGVGELRRVLERDVLARRDLLKARSVLGALGRLVRTVEVPGGERLAAQLEALVAGAHELAEVRLLAGLRSGAVDLAGDLEAEVEQLLRAGTTWERLGLGPEAGGEEVRRRITEGVGRWRRRAEMPTTPKPQREAAAVVVRSYEGLLATVPPSAPG